MNRLVWVFFGPAYSTCGIVIFTLLRGFAGVQCRHVSIYSWPSHRQRQGWIALSLDIRDNPVFPLALGFHQSLVCFFV